MKKHFLNKMRSSIKKQYPNYTDDKIDEIMYGIEGIYLTITKTIIIFAIAFILNIHKELLLLLITFNFIRFSGFGMHANKSWICLLFSSSLFIGGTYLCKYVVFNNFLLYLLYLFVLVIMIFFAPADTIKRPLIKAAKRKRYKILSIITALIYFIITVLINNQLLTNCLIIGLLIECILILPITYSLFKMPYKNYGLNT